MGGREAFSRPHETRSDILKNMAELKKPGVNVFLYKPFRKAELARLVGDLAGRRSKSF
jgi:hypothetical protein